MVSAFRKNLSFVFTKWACRIAVIYEVFFLTLFNCRSDDLVPLLSAFPLVVFSYDFHLAKVKLRPND